MNIFLKKSMFLYYCTNKYLESEIFDIKQCKIDIQKLKKHLLYYKDLLTIYLNNVKNNEINNLHIINNDINENIDDI